MTIDQLALRFFQGCWTAGALFFGCAVGWTLVTNWLRRGEDLTPVDAFGVRREFWLEREEP